jgi:predicted nucleic acid-binding protein
MAERLVAADASPLIGLAAAGGFELLRRLFGQIVVTAQVRDEVLAGGELPGVSELASAIREGWIKVEHTRTDATTFLDLDVGEASTLTLAVAHAGSCLVLMDESLGRSYARAHGLNVTGLAGVLLAAKNAHLVQSVRPFFDRLKKSNFRLSTAIVHAVLEQAGEANPRT